MHEIFSLQLGEARGFIELPRTASWRAASRFLEGAALLVDSAHNLRKFLGVFIRHPTLPLTLHTFPRRSRLDSFISQAAVTASLKNTMTDPANGMYVLY